MSRLKTKDPSNVSFTGRPFLSVVGPIFLSLHHLPPSVPQYLLRSVSSFTVFLRWDGSPWKAGASSPLARCVCAGWAAAGPPTEGSGFPAGPSECSWPAGAEAPAPWLRGAPCVCARGQLAVNRIWVRDFAIRIVTVPFSASDCVAGHTRPAFLPVRTTFS